MKRYISASAKVDLSRIKSIGDQIIQELREFYPEIPKRPKYKRKKVTAITRIWCIQFDLGFSVKDLARDYMNDTDPGNYDLYWDYIHNFMNICKPIVDSYSDDTVECSISYQNVDGPRKYSQGTQTLDHAVLNIYDLETEV